MVFNFADHWYTFVMNSVETSPAHVDIMSLQGIVEEQLRDLPVAFHALDQESQGKFCDRARAHVAFELSKLENAWNVMPLCATGEGYFLTYDPKCKPGEKFGLRQLGKGNWLYGLLGEPHIMLVPPLSTCYSDETANLRDLSLSVILELNMPRLGLVDNLYQFPESVYVFLPLLYPGLTYDQQDIAYIEAD